MSRPNIGSSTRRLCAPNDSVSKGSILLSVPVLSLDSNFFALRVFSDASAEILYYIDLTV
jgi:hypothetical protein